MQSALESLVDAEVGVYPRNTFLCHIILQSSGVRLEAEREGIDIALLQEMFANFVSSRLIVLEELYETLVEFTHKGIKVPPIALNAIIAASGFINDLDRGFAIIQEYSSKFRLSLDVHAYNALLCAVARSADKGFMKTVLLILERMESEGIQPNSVSFSYLCDVMVDSAHYHSLNEILDHSKKVGQHPSQKSLRRLCVALTAHPVHYPLAETVVELIDKDPDTGKLPNFLLKRLAFVEEKRKARRISEK